MVRNFALLSMAVVFGWIFSSAFAQPCQSTVLTAVISPSDTAYACDGAPLQLSGSAIGGTPLAWEWSTMETDRDITVTTPGTYWLAVYDASGCTDTTFVEVIHLPKPSVDLGPDRTICDGDSVILDGGPNVSWSWSTGEATSTIVVSTPITVALVVTNSFSCSDSDTVTIFQFPVPTVEIGNDTAVCQGETVILEADPGFPSYLWSNGDTTNMIMVTATGAYAVVVTDSNGCSTPSNTANITVNIPTTPVISELNNVLSSTASDAYQWYMDGNLLTGETFQDHTPDSSGIFIVEITDANGCVASSAPYDFILFQEITTDLISQGISPNGDGVLDDWQIPYIEFYPDNELVIFNRWGNTVFKRSSYTNADPWAGQNENGKDLTDGVYFYILDLGGDNGKVQGQVVINR